MTDNAPRFVLVPVEPTEEMLDAVIVNNGVGPMTARKVYKAMIAAAPTEQATKYVKGTALSCACQFDPMLDEPILECEYHKNRYKTEPKGVELDVLKLEILKAATEWPYQKGRIQKSSVLWAINYLAARGIINAAKQNSDGAYGLYASPSEGMEPVSNVGSPEHRPDAKPEDAVEGRDPTGLLNINASQARIIGELRKEIEALKRLTYTKETSGRSQQS